MENQPTLRETKKHGAAWFPFNISPCAIPQDFTQVALHWQDSMELVFVKKGRGIVQAGLTSYTAAAGDLYVFAPAVLHALRRHPVRGGVAHAFNGSLQQAAEFIKLGFKLGFGGALTHAGSRRIRMLATELPLSALVLETDAPDIAPAWLHGGRNSPEQLPRIAAELAQLRGMSVEELVAHTDANAREVFPGLDAGC